MLQRLGLDSIRTRREILAFLAVFAASAGCAKNTVVLTQVDEQELMARWNATVDGVMMQNFNFYWRTFDQFPHPTYQGGSEAAYQKFAEILVSFYSRGDNFEYLAQNHLFTYPLKSSLGLMTTFQDLTEMLLHNGTTLSADMQRQLSDFDTRIRAVPPP
jgi:hypothetical protein